MSDLGWLTKPHRDLVRETISAQMSGSKPEAVDRAKLIAHITFVMPELSDAALARLAEMADELRKSGARDLSSGTLAAEQRGREMAHG